MYEIVKRKTKLQKTAGGKHYKKDKKARTGSEEKMSRN